jgi:cytoskeletal protein CcmA (bactofilin family)
VLSGKRKLDDSATDTIIGEGTVCEGKIMSEASLRIEGQVQGDIECAGDITIGERANVQSSITARDIIIAGTVKGNVTSKGKLTIMSTGQLIGNIDVRSFIIMEGGLFQGTSNMKAPAAAEAISGGKVIDAIAHKQNKEAAVAAGSN